MGIILEAVGVFSKQAEPSLNISRAWIFIAQGARTVAAGGGEGNWLNCHRVFTNLVT